MSSVSAALVAATPVTTGEPESKRQHTEMEAVVQGMSSDNQALFKALTGYVDQKMDKRFYRSQSCDDGNGRGDRQSFR